MSIWTDFLQDFGIDIVTEFSDKPIGYKAPVKIAGPVYSTVKDFEKLAPDAPGVEYRIAAGNTVASVVAGEIAGTATESALALIARMTGLVISAPAATIISIGVGVWAGIGYGLDVADDVRELVLNILEDPEWYFDSFDVVEITLPDGKIIRAAAGSDANNTYALSNWFDNGFSSFLGLGGNDEIEGNDQDNYLWGDAGDDTLVGSAGNDDLFGGTGIDRVDYSQSNSSAVVNLTTGLALAGGNSVDHLYEIEEVLGTAFGDALIGNAQNNLLFGDEGNDTLSGVSGHNLLDGGENDDQLIAGDNGDTLIGGTGADAIITGKGDDLILLGTTDSYDSLTPLPDNAADRVIYTGGHDAILGSDGPVGADVTVIDSGDTATKATVSSDGPPLAQNFNIDFGDGNSLYLDAWGEAIDQSNVQFSDGSVLAYVPEADGTYVGGDNNDLLIGGTGQVVLKGGADTDWLIGGGGKPGVYNYLFGEKDPDIFEFGNRGMVMDATDEDFISWAGATKQITGGVQQFWQEGNWAYYTPFSGILAGGSSIGLLSDLLYAQSVLTDLAVGANFRFGLTESHQLLIQIGRGRAGVMVMNDYDLDPETGEASGNVVAYQLDYRTGKSATLAQIKETLNLALHASFGLSYPSADPLMIDLEGDGLELSRESASKAYWDFDGDSFAEHTAWAKKDDGFIARDSNNNGKIDGMGDPIRFPCPPAQMLREKSSPMALHHGREMAY